MPPPPPIDAHTFDRIDSLELAIGWSSGPPATPSLPHERPAWLLKRGLDVIGAGLLLLLALPILALAALAIRLDSPGPIFFKQTRCGRGGRPFPIFKLRTMVDGAEAQRAALEAANEASGPVFKMRRDPRITRVGAFLRRWSLDELPQLWNVLRGEMSLVGPRPPIPSEVAEYGPREQRRLTVTPGITGLWQVSGRSDVDFERWVSLDIEYIETWSPKRDVAILLRTIPAVLSGRGAY